MGSKHVLEIKNFSYQYGKFTAVDNLNLEVPEGEIFGFLGPNGAGKTTTIRSILDFLRPKTGEIKVFGLDSQKDSLAIQKQIGYLSSELVLWENWTGAQYIAWLESVREQELMTEAQRLAERLDFDLTRSLKGMSTGMKRKIGLISTLVHKPALLILDEPTIGLDPLMQKAFEELMREVRAEGRTVFLSSHILPEVEAICDRVAIIRHGELQAVHTIGELTDISFRWLTVYTPQKDALADVFRQIEGISELSTNGQKVKMRVSGTANIDQLVKNMAQYTIEDMEFDHPDLEETFLAYYGNGQGE